MDDWGECVFGPVEYVSGCEGRWSLLAGANLEGRLLTPAGGGVEA
jgi:hypothetical protein